MTISITFFSNFFNSHQLPISLELEAREDVTYTFVAMERIENLQGRECLNDEYDFVVKSYEGGNEKSIALNHAIEDDIVVFGDMAGKEGYVRARAQTGKPFFRYAERLLKRGDWWRLIPLKQYRTWSRFTRYRRDNMLVLCASAYTARDLSLFGFPVDRCLAWGYFPQIEMGLSRVRPMRDDGYIRMCSAQRLIDWKRVDLQIELAAKLNEEGYGFKLSIAGEGALLGSLKRLAVERGVSESVEFLGRLSALETQRLMAESDIFLATSNRKEGWGATVNEAMALGCAVVGSDAMGSVPYLIEDGLNGCTFVSESADSLLASSMRLIKDRGLLRSVSERAIQTLSSIWSPEEATSRLVTFSRAWLSGSSPERFASGPMSGELELEV